MRFIHLDCLKKWIGSKLTYDNKPNIVSISWTTFECELCQTIFPSNFNKKPYIFTGLQIVNTKILEEHAGKKIFSLSEVFKERSAKKRISALIHDDKWLHIGDLKGLEDAKPYFGN